MQATADGTATATPTSTPANDLAVDIYALIVYLHKQCNNDLFEAVGSLELSLSQIKLLGHLADVSGPISLKEAAEFVHVSLPAPAGWSTTSCAAASSSATRTPRTAG